jgi:hypothetical protein
MAGKKLWISALTKDEPRIAKFNAGLRQYGFDAGGHVWLDEPDKLAWRVAYDELQKRKTDCWVILADAASLAKPTIRYALSLMAYAMRRDLNDRLPIIVLGSETLRDLLPEALQGVKIIDDNVAGWQAKIVAGTLKTPAEHPLPYRVDVYGNDKIGQWLEIGPREGVWQGIIFGVAGNDASITFQAVGPAGKLPEKTTLEYAREGMKLEAAGKDYIAGSVRNVIDPNASYFVRIKGLPQSLLILPDEGSADQEQPEAFVLTLS